MLIKKDKNKEILFQREYLANVLSKKFQLGYKKFFYRGYLFEENKKFFINKGYTIFKITDPILCAKFHCKDLHKFIPSEDTLKSKEMQNQTFLNFKMFLPRMEYETYDPFGNIIKYMPEPPRMDFIIFSDECKL